MLWFIISLLIIGLIAGFVARLLVPGPDPDERVRHARPGYRRLVHRWLPRLGLIFGKDIDEGALQASGIIGSIVGAVIALLVYRFAVSRGRGRRPRPLIPGPPALEAAHRKGAVSGSRTRRQLRMRSTHSIASRRA